MSANPIDGQKEESWCALLGDFFTIFAHPTRMRIFCALQDGRQTVSTISGHAGISLQNASQHLRLMRDKGALKTQKEGHFVYYTVADSRFIEAAHLIRDALIDGMLQRTQAMAPSAAAPTLPVDSTV